MGIKYEFGPFVLDPGEYSLWRDGELAEIAPKEFGILVYFIENRDRLLTKDEILEKHWPDEFVAESTWTKSLYRLRKALGDDGETYIKCLPRRGYRWISSVREIAPVDQSRGLVMNEVPDVMDNAQANAILALVQKAAPQLRSADSDVWLKVLDEQENNVRAALDYYRRAGSKGELELAVAIAPFWDLRDRWTEGRERLGAALSRGFDDLELRMKGLAAYGYLLAHNDDRAAAVLNEGITLAPQVEDYRSLSFCYYSLGFASDVKGDHPRAKSLFLQSLRVAKQHDLQLLQAWALRGLGQVAKAQMDRRSARQWLSDSLDIRSRLGDSGGSSTAQILLSMVTDDPRQARRLLEQSVSASTVRGHRWIQAVGWQAFGVIEEASGNNKDALVAYRTALELRQTIGDSRGTARSKESIARLSALSGDHKNAARIYGEADAIRERISAPLSPDEKSLHEALKIEVKKKFFSVYEQGRKDPDLSA